MRETITPPLIGWSRAFPATPALVREARQFLAAIMGGRPAADDAVLCLSELVTNATLHSRSREPNGQFSVRVQLHGSRLRVEVSDQGGPWIQAADKDEQHGRGLLIVGRLARDWGRTGGDKAGWTVWFEVECP
jgi:anti-sigma regulatory factor (Ser/Thr protein kinase)